MKLYIGSNRILGGTCSVEFRTGMVFQMAERDGRLRCFIDVCDADGLRVATYENGTWVLVGEGYDATADGARVLLRRGDATLVDLKIRPNFTKLTAADIYGPGRQRMLIGADGELQLQNAAGGIQVEISECEFLEAADLKEVEPGTLGGDKAIVHGSGISYTPDAAGYLIDTSTFSASQPPTPTVLATAGISLN